MPSSFLVSLILIISAHPATSMETVKAEPSNDPSSPPMIRLSPLKDDRANIVPKSHISNSVSNDYSLYRETFNSERISYELNEDDRSSLISSGSFSSSANFCRQQPEENWAKRCQKRMKRMVLSKKISTQDHPYKEIFNKFFTDGYNDPLQYILIHTIKNPKTLWRIRSVCTQWNGLIQTTLEAFEGALTPQANFAILLQNYGASPLLTCRIYEYFSESHIAQEKLLTANFVSAISSSSFALSNLGHYYSQLDPLECQAVELATSITKKIPELQNHLWSIYNKYNFNFDKFSKMSKNLTSHSTMRKSLMTLKILSLSGDTAAQIQMDIFENILSKYLSCLNTKGKSYLINHPRLTSQPIWGAYLVTTEKNSSTKNSALRGQYRHLKIAMRASTCSPKIKLDPQQIQSFAIYALTVDPGIPQESQDHFNDAFREINKLCTDLRRIDFV